MLSFDVRDEFPNSNVWVSEKPVLSNKFWSVLLKQLRSVQRSLLYKGQWRKIWITDSKPLPQLHIGFIEPWKPSLNLWYHNWLRPSLVIYLIPIGLWQIHKTKRRSYEFCFVYLFIWRLWSYDIFADWHLICFIQL